VQLEAAPVIAAAGIQLLLLLLPLPWTLYIPVALAAAAAWEVACAGSSSQGISSAGSWCLC
jgi:hypothetical protein